MKVSICTILDAPPEHVWAEVQTSRLLDYVAAPLLHFRPMDATALPHTWTDGEHRVRMLAFGVIPIGWQIIGTSYPPVPSPQLRLLRDNGRGALIKKWDHLITVSDRPDGRTDYRDDVEIDAGLLTPFVVLYAHIFYRHRQRRWRALVRNDFDYRKGVA